MKIDLYIARAGAASRRKAQELIKAGAVLINGKRAGQNTLVSAGDKVTMNGVPVSAEAFRPVILAYHKPRGIVCTTEKVPGNISDAMKYGQTVYPVGRLDKNSEGLLLLTNQGELIDAIANAAHHHEKEYVVTLNMPVRARFVEELRNGMDLNGETTRPCRASIEPGTKRVLRIVLTQGLNRQIRRMCTQAGYQVIKLVRVRVMNIVLGGLAPGAYRELSEEEKKELLVQLP